MELTDGIPGKSVKEPMSGVPVGGEAKDQAVGGKDEGCDPGLQEVSLLEEGISNDSQPEIPNLWQAMLIQGVQPGASSRDRC